MGLRVGLSQREVWGVFLFFFGTQFSELVEISALTLKDWIAKEWEGCNKMEALILQK